MTRDDLFNGNGRRIVEASYRVIDALQYEPKPRQVQAVAAVFLAVIETLKMRPAEILEVVAKILKEETNYATTRALFGYLKAKLGGD